MLEAGSVRSKNVTSVVIKGLLCTGKLDYALLFFSLQLIPELPIPADLKEIFH
jgi:hypothetical protein